MLNWSWAAAVQAEAGDPFLKYLQCALKHPCHRYFVAAENLFVKRTRRKFSMSQIVNDAETMLCQYYNRGVDTIYRCYTLQTGLLAGSMWIPDAAVLWLTHLHD